MAKKQAENIGTTMLCESITGKGCGLKKIIGIIGSNTKEKILSFPGVCAAVADFREAKDLLAEDFPALRR